MTSPPINATVMVTPAATPAAESLVVVSRPAKTPRMSATAVNPLRTPNIIAIDRPKLRRRSCTCATVHA